MPLKKVPPGSNASEEAEIIQQNIEMLIKEGKPPKQAVAIAYDSARRDK